VKYLKDLAGQRGHEIDVESMTKEEVAQKIQDYLCPTDSPTPTLEREIAQLANRLACDAEVPPTRGQTQQLVYLGNTYLHPRSHDDVS